MIVFVVILCLKLQVFFVKCELEFVDPIIPKHETTVESIIYMLGGMSPYNSPKETLSDNSKDLNDLNSCTATKALLLIRHGPKYSKHSVMDGFEKLKLFQETIKSAYPTDNEENKIINDIKKWKNIMSHEKAKSTNELGVTTIKNIAESWNAKLKNIVENIEEKDIRFQPATDCDRCTETGKIFLEVFFNGKINAESINIESPKERDDGIELKKAKKEELMVLNEETKKRTLAEEIYFQIAWKNGSYNLQSKIQDLLFSDENHRKYRDLINIDFIKIMYSACAHSYGYNYDGDMPGHAWCGVFDYADLEIFEGFYDIQYYYKNGYHSTIMSNVGHPMMKEILNFLNNSGTKKFKLFSGHRANCMSLITGFRLYRDETKLTVENMTQGDKMKNRKWRSSLIGNYGCNIMVVVYDCGDLKKVSIYLNEIPLKMISETQETCEQCPIDDVKILIKKLLLN